MSVISGGQKSISFSLFFNSLKRKRLWLSAHLCRCRPPNLHERWLLGPHRLKFDLSLEGNPDYDLSNIAYNLTFCLPKDFQECRQALELSLAERSRWFLEISPGATLAVYKENGGAVSYQRTREGYREWGVQKFCLLLHSQDFFKNRRFFHWR